MKTIELIKRPWVFLLLTLVVVSCQEDETLKEDPELKHGRHHQGHSKRDVYVLVHGAWHPSSSWSDVAFLLEKAGHTVKAVQLPGLGNDNTPLETVTFQSHVEAVQNVVASQWKPVILVGHGYGGAVVSQVGENVPDKIKKLVYVSGIMPMNGETVADNALSDTASLVTKFLQVDEAGIGAFMTDELYKEAIFNVAMKLDPLTRWKAKKVVSQLRPHPLATLFAPLELGPDYDGLSKTYISCLKDQAATPAAQRGMYSRFPGVRVYYLYSDHGAAVTAPFQLTQLLLKR